jgi:hypothetical protein
MSKPKVAARRDVCRKTCLLILAAASGCSTPGAHFVSQTSEGGVIAIPTNSDQWPTYYRSQAERLMSQTCPNGYAIIREDVFVKEPAETRNLAANDTYDFDYNGALVRYPRNIREEYHITFRCLPPPKGVPPPAGGDLPMPKVVPPSPIPPG